MMMLIAIRTKPGVSLDKLTNRLNEAEDWFRFQEGAWLIRDSRGPDWWQRHLETLVRPGGHVWIAVVDPEQTAGFMTEAFWDWAES